MKQCPNCHKDIPDDAKVCPYCGMPQRGYQPMKRRKYNKNRSRIALMLLAFFFIFSPLIAFSFFIDNDLISSSSDNQNVTVGTYEEKLRDTVTHRYESLAAFKKHVTNSSQYISVLEDKESQLKTLYPQSEIDKDYLFDITKGNNVYVSASYEIKDGQNKIMIDYNYDLTNQNECEITYQVDHLTLDQIKQFDLDSVKKLVYIFDQNKNSKLMDRSQKEFISLLDKSDLTKQISHYGLGNVKESGKKSCSFRIFNQNDQYRLKFGYKTQIK